MKKKTKPGGSFQVASVLSQLFSKIEIVTPDKNKNIARYLFIVFVTLLFLFLLLLVEGGDQDGEKSDCFSDQLDKIFGGHQKQ